jgi:hypothetical protein
MKEVRKTVTHTRYPTNTSPSHGREFDDIVLIMLLLVLQLYAQLQRLYQRDSLLRLLFGQRLLCRLQRS